MNTFWLKIKNFIYNLYLKITRLDIKLHLFRIKYFLKKYPVFIYLVIFVLSVFILNNILINFQKTDISKYPQYFTFPEFESKEKKYDFLEKLYNELRHLDYAKFEIHTVEKKENYWGIAHEHNIDIDTIVGLNPYLKNLYAGVNEKIIVCNKNGCLHYINKDENINTIAKLYNVPLSLLKKANNLNIIKMLFFPPHEGDFLFIPDTRPRLITTNMQTLYEKRNFLQSPLGGRYTSNFGFRMHPILKTRQFHYGLDIKAYIGQPVSASRYGVVVFTGWAGGLGNYIRIQHDNGYETGYGHLSRILVRVGQKVRTGQIIGKAGMTGMTTGPHVHFQVIYKGKQLDPAQYLW